MWKEKTKTDGRKQMADELWKKIEKKLPPNDTEFHGYVIIHPSWDYTMRLPLNSIND